MKTEKFKVTPLERAWILYDVGNSAFVLMIATLVPIFFNALAEAGGVSKVDYLAYWGYASSIVTVVTAILGPILGTLADTKGFKKPIFMLCLFVGVIGCCAMGLAGTWLAFLIIFIIAKIGYSGSLVFYDSMLGDVTTPERMDMVSSRGYAWGYIGSCVPFVVCLALVLGSSVVAFGHPAAAVIIPPDHLCGGGAARHPAELCAHWADPEASAAGQAGVLVPAGLLLLHRRRVHHH